MFNIYGMLFLALNSCDKTVKTFWKFLNFFCMIFYSNMNSFLLFIALAMHIPNLYDQIYHYIWRHSMTVVKYPVCSYGMEWQREQRHYFCYYYYYYYYYHYYYCGSVSMHNSCAKKIHEFYMCSSFFCCSLLCMSSCHHSLNVSNSSKYFSISVKKIWLKSLTFSEI